MAITTLNNLSINRSDTAVADDHWTATSATASDFQAPAGSDFVKLASTSCSAAATLAIDGFFTSDYDRYILYCIGIGFTDTTPAASDRFTFRFNQSASAVTSGYQFAKLFCYNSGVSAQTDATYFFGMYLNENELTNRGNLIIEIMDPLQTSFNHACF